MYVYQKKYDLSIYNQVAQKEEIYLPDFYYQDRGYHASGIVFTISKSNNFQNNLTIW